MSVLDSSLLMEFLAEQPFNIICYYFAIIPAKSAIHSAICDVSMNVVWTQNQLYRAGGIPNPHIPDAAGISLIPYVAPAGEPPLTVGGEFDKLASDIAIGRNAAGVHYRSGYVQDLLLGEAVAIGLHEEQKPTYNENFSFTLTRFDGRTTTI